ncbi:unnamed protein product [Protopolystoma xenopodis]|uniref:Uncharacterized protein n=1 Tax=Protopolystoma xenopodis TaxID=117903 RepID=A0A3S5A139_9PLAT|nr:unnamed protein product [Protopolystoma xenopodis]
MDRMVSKKSVDVFLFYRLVQLIQAVCHNQSIRRLVTAEESRVDSRPTYQPYDSTIGTLGNAPFSPLTTSTSAHWPFNIIIPETCTTSLNYTSTPEQTTLVGQVYSNTRKQPVFGHSNVNHDGEEYAGARILQVSTEQ